MVSIWTRPRSKTEREEHIDHENINASNRANCLDMLTATVGSLFSLDQATKSNNLSGSTKAKHAQFDNLASLAWSKLKTGTLCFALRGHAVCPNFCFQSWRGWQSKASDSLLSHGDQRLCGRKRASRFVWLGPSCKQALFAFGQPNEDFPYTQ